MAGDKTALGDRMKVYEQVTRYQLPRRTYTLIRADGRCFTNFLRYAERPFDAGFMAAMDEVALALCSEITGALFAFTQSDEVSVLVTDFDSTQTQPWLNGIVQKLVSISASIATAAFNQATVRHQLDVVEHGTATFDARVFTIPDPVEVANCLVWRQRDAVRNSILMAGQAHFSHEELQGVSTDQIQELLWREKNTNWNDYPVGCKRGRVTIRQPSEREATFTDGRTGQEATATVVRSSWVTQPAPHFTAGPGGFLAENIPPLPSLTKEPVDA